MELDDLVENIYGAINNSGAEELGDYLAEDVQIIPLSRPAEIISGKKAALASIGKMLSIAKGTKVTFISGPTTMGNVVTVEYTHDYVLNGDSIQDHNVSLFVILGGQVKQWIGYIHPK